MTDVGCRCQDNWVKLGIVPARAEPFSNRVVMLVLGSQQRSWYQREASMSLSPEREKPELHLDSRHQAKWSIAYLPCSEITSGPPERGQTATSGRTARTSPTMRSFMYISSGLSFRPSEAKQVPALPCTVPARPLRLPPLPLANAAPEAQAPRCRPPAPGKPCPAQGDSALYWRGLS